MADTKRTNKKRTKQQKNDESSSERNFWNLRRIFVLLDQTVLLLYGTKKKDARRKHHECYVRSQTQPKKNERANTTNGSIVGTMVSYGNSSSQSNGNIRYCLAVCAILVVVATTISVPTRRSSNYDENDSNENIVRKYSKRGLSNQNVLSSSGTKRASTFTVVDKEEFLEGVSYSQLRSAVVGLYHASDPETTDIEEQFDEALEAMSKIESDGQPVPINGITGLYVGSIGTCFRYFSFFFS